MFNIASKISAEAFVSTCRKNDLTLLHLAALESNTQAVQHLIKLPYIHKIVNDKSNHERLTPLLIATVIGSKRTDLDLIKMLADNGADLSSQADDGSTLIHLAT